MERQIKLNRDSKKNLCLAYAAGPGDIVKTFACWQKGKDDPHQLAVTYSSQFFSACRSLGARGIAISSCPREEQIVTDQFHVENFPKGKSRRGLNFHLDQVRYLRDVIRKARSGGADLLVMSEGTGHFFPFQWLAPADMALVPSIHCTIWPKYFTVSKTQFLLNLLNRRIYTKRASSILCLSEDIRKQIVHVAGESHSPIIPFIPTYRKETFQHIAAPSPENQFNLLYAGRMEREKGIFDLLQIAVELRRKGASQIHIHLCGDGSSEKELRDLAHSRNVESIFHVHGYCHRPEMLHHIEESHAFIVPTTTTFGEGFNKVVVEGILSGRPVITSTVCPAIEMVRPAVIEVPPDDPSGYLDAAERLASDKALYNRMQQATSGLRNQFYAPENSWEQALILAVERWANDR